LPRWDPILCVPRTLISESETRHKRCKAHILLETDLALCRNSNPYETPTRYIRGARNQTATCHRRRNSCVSGWLAEDSSVIIKMAILRPLVYVYFNDTKINRVREEAANMRCGWLETGLLNLSTLNLRRDSYSSIWLIVRRVLFYSIILTVIFLYVNNWHYKWYFISGISLHYKYGYCKGVSLLLQIAIL